MKCSGKILFSLRSVLLGVVISLFFGAQLSAKPAIEWGPRNLITEQMQGTLLAPVMTMETSGDAPGSVVRVTPGPARWGSVSPASIESLLTGERVDIAASINLPPDPGEAGKKTLLGIDSDGDGVRDDIQRYIYFTHIDKEKVQAALTEVAKHFQILLPDVSAALANATKMARHRECLYSFIGEEAADVLASLRAEILNTRERSTAYIAYSDSLGGEIILFRPLADWSNSCSFDPSAIGTSQ